MHRTCAVKGGAEPVDDVGVTRTGSDGGRAGPPSSGWLVRSALDRARLVDMNGRVRTARRVQGASCGGAAAFSALWYGWWILVLTATAILTLVALDRFHDRMQRPERGSVLSLAVFELLICGVVAGTGGARSPFVGFLAVPLMMLAARFRPHVVAVGCGAALVATAVAFSAAAVLPDPAEVPTVVPVLGYLALVTSLVAATTALLTAELASRGDALVDALTGLFNRKGLHLRFEQAAAQARVLDQPVSVVMCDLDHFKQVNDNHGHDRGDAVLRAAADELRATLRTLDLIYRFGGEEFLVLLPGHDAAAALRVAERLVLAVGRAPLDGLRVTLSAGTSSARGGDVDYLRQLREADEALYAAKAGGRNQARAFDTAPSVPESASVPGQGPAPEQGSAPVRTATGPEQA